MRTDRRGSLFISQKYLLIVDVAEAQAVRRALLDYETKTERILKI